MKQILIIIFSLILFNAYGQKLETLSEVKLDRDDNNILILEKGWSLRINPDSAWIVQILEFEKNGELKLKDSADLSPYGFNFRFLKSNRKNDYILIIETVYEYVSHYPIYLMRKDKIEKIGNLDIRLDCDDCDALNYPLNDIIIKGNNNRIEFSFKKDLVFVDNKDFPKLKKDEIKFVYEFDSEKLIIEKSTGANMR